MQSPVKRSLTPAAPAVSMPNDWSRFDDSQMSQIRDFVNDQKKVVGLVVSTAAGTQVEVNLDIPQQGKLLLGFCFVNVVPNGPVNVLLNNEKFVDSVNGRFFVQGVNNSEFYYYPRPLTGIDKLTLQVTDTAAQQVLFAAYYI